MGASEILQVVGQGGIYGLGWFLFIFMMFRELRERKRYSDLVIHIIQYFTKVNMIKGYENHDESPLTDLFNLPNKARRDKPTPRRHTRVSYDEE